MKVLVMTLLAVPPPSHYLPSETMYSCIKIVYFFAKAAVTKYHKVGGSTEMYCLIVLEARSLSLRCPCSWFPLRAVKENLFQASLLASHGLLSGIPWFLLYDPNVCLHLHVVLCLCVCVCI